MFARLFATLLLLAASVAAGADEPALVPAERLAKILAIDNWDESRFAKFIDRTPVSVDEQFEMIRLAQRLDSLDATLFKAAGKVDSIQSVAEKSDDKGRLVRVAGRAKSLLAIALEPADAERLAIEQVYITTIEDDDGNEASVLSIDVPDDWPIGKQLDEPATVGGVFVKIAMGDGREFPVVVAPRIEWYPTKVAPPMVNYGEALLGIYGYDVAQLDAVAQRQRFTRRESAAFYALLELMGEGNPGPLAERAKKNLQGQAELWRRRVVALGGDTPPADADAKKEWTLARVALVAARDGRFSVAPFFNEPDKHTGELVVLDGTVRRAVRIDLAGGIDGAGDPTATDYEVPYYYQLDLFTEDSQNNPIVFCVRQLPEGFPTGEGLFEPVRVAGFFYKTWGYTARGNAEAGDKNRRNAPLFIGAGPLLFAEPEPAFPWGGVAGGSIIAVIGLLWFVGWRWSRSDRAYERHIRNQFADERPTFPE